MKWRDAMALHQHVVNDVVSAAGRVPAEKWLLPRADGRWSAAEVVEHLTLSYVVAIRELGGGPGMRIKTGKWQRILLRLTVMPKILRGGGFPAGVRAPREIRPAVGNSDQAEAMASFRGRAAEFLEAVARAGEAGRRARLTHPYFGVLPLDDALLLLTRHLQHHLKQIEGRPGV